MSNFKLFLCSMLCTALGVLGYLYFERQIDLRHQPKLTLISDGVFLTSQLTPDHLRYLRRMRIFTIVDMRPDGEAVDQPSSDDMKRAAEARGMEFHYIPVPHESLPDEAVSSLRTVLEERSRSMVLYCRTGRRAVRLFALASASLEDGPDCVEIQRMVKDAGFTAEDLTAQIAERIAKRGSAQPGESK